jgi:uncharacterized cofD-like protein
MEKSAKKPRIVVIGGGTGLSTMLRGLKKFDTILTAIVTVADDGGNSGALRDDLGILPPGDIRNCIVALAEVEPVMEELLQYRFKDGSLNGQCFGNLFLAAMAGISENFEDAVRKMSKVLAVKGRVLPVTLEDIKLKAVLDDNTIIYGESNIGSIRNTNKHVIKDIILEPVDAKINPEALNEIDKADMIVIGPGSLYTSIVPNLLINGMVEAIEKSKAVKAYICNVMTQPGETDNMNASEHFREISRFLGYIVDYIVLNSGEISDDMLSQYSKDGASIVKIDADMKYFDIKMIKENLICTKKGYIRHNPEILARVLLNLYREESN